jgi:hypothetical protein
LPDYESGFEKRIRDVNESLAESSPIPIWEVIGFPVNVFETLPRSTAEFLGRGAEPAETTFRRFVAESGNSLRPKDAENASDDVVARVGAARIAKWLERLVLPGQDILVDAPHLVWRFPTLLAGDVGEIETWNRTARLANYEALGLTTEVIEPFHAKKAHWLSRPAWFWNDLRECEEIAEVREPWKVNAPEWVFCEDASRFCMEPYKEFVADTESPYARRFVKEFGGVDYVPLLRFSL